MRKDPTRALDRASAALADGMRVDDRDIERRLALVEFEPADAVRMRALGPFVQPQSDRLVTEFFDHLRAATDKPTLFENNALFETARTLKSEHLRAMFEGSYGRAYADERLKLGALYAQVGVEPRAFLGAFHHLLDTIGMQIVAKAGSDGAEAFARQMSFKKIAFFDVSLIVDAIVYERERVIRVQQEAIRELSTPVLKVRERVLMIPMIGALDSERARGLTDQLLTAIRVHRARAVVLDVTGVSIVDSDVADRLLRAIRAARMMGARTIVTGISSEVSRALVALGITGNDLDTAGDLQQGLDEADEIVRENELPVERDATDEI